MVGEVGFSFGKGFVGGEGFAVLAAIGDVVGKLIGGIGEDGGSETPIARRREDLSELLYLATVVLILVVRT